MDWSEIAGQRTERIPLTRLTSNSHGLNGEFEEGNENNCIFIGDRMDRQPKHSTQLFTRLRSLQWLLIVSFTFNCLLLVLFLLFYTQLRSSQGSLAREVGRIGSNLKDMNKDIGALRRGHGLSCDFWSALEPLNTISLGCGGLLTIPAMETSLFFHYLSNQTETYSQSQRCLWALSSRGDGHDGNDEHDGRSYSLKVRVQLLCDGFGNSKDLLSFIEWSVEGGLSSHPLEINTHDYITEEYVDGLFLSFTSDDHPVGSYFILRLDVLGVFEQFQGSFADARTVPGSGSYGPFSKGHAFSLVLNPERGRTTALTVKYVDSYHLIIPPDTANTMDCYHEDSLDIFEILEGGFPNLLDRLCGEIKSPKEFTGHYPFLILFYTDESTSGRGFGLEWKALPPISTAPSAHPLMLN